MPLRAAFLLVSLALAHCTTQAGRPADPAPPAGEVACTREAKLCPDGTAVGRTGPDCAFAPCPGEGPRDVRPCPDAAACTGPRPLAPESLCPDGKTTAGPVCADVGDGACGWVLRECPP